MVVGVLVWRRDLGMLLWSRLVRYGVIGGGGEVGGGCGVA